MKTHYVSHFHRTLDDKRLTVTMCGRNDYKNPKAIASDLDKITCKSCRKTKRFILHCSHLTSQEFGKKLIFL